MEVGTLNAYGLMLSCWLSSVYVLTEKTLFNFEGIIKLTKNVQ